MIVASIAEIVSLGAVLPFLSVLTSPDMLFGHPLAQPFVQFMGYSNPGELLLPLTLSFCGAAVLAGGLRMALLWTSTRLSFGLGADLSISIYRRTLYQPYSVHVSRNSSEVISGISTKTNVVVNNVLDPLLTLISSSVMLVGILAGILWINYIMALVAIGIVGVLYTIIIMMTRDQLLDNSRKIAVESKEVIKTLQEGLGGIRDVLLDGAQEVYCKTYRTADLQLRKAQGGNQFISQSPRYAMEALGMVVISGIAYGLTKGSEGAAIAIPLLGVLALGAQRMMPLLQHAYWAWACIRGGLVSLQDVLKLLEPPIPDLSVKSEGQAVPFERHIELRNVSFSYGKEGRMVIDDVNLCIPKGVRIGFVGKTGSGKTTLLDVIMGLLEPDKGTIKIDGQSIHNGNRRTWQAHIAHVPQNIFLADCSIEENIAFGVPSHEIDRVRVRWAAEQAQLLDLIGKTTGSYNTMVGERGSRLSGGQRQRIGIARALYKKADILVFDEATSALDNETEKLVMQCIEKLSRELTILIIAHRITTLQCCSKVVEVANGRISRVCSYKDVVETYHPK
jgi:ATP-binding cassette subfamily B protein